MSPQECLLRDVLRLRGVPEHPERERVDPMLVGADQLLERPAVPRSEPADELRGVARRRLSHGVGHPRAEAIAHGEPRTS